MTAPTAEQIRQALKNTIAPQINKSGAVLAAWKNSQNPDRALCVGCQTHLIKTEMGFCDRCKDWDRLLAGVVP